MRNKIMKAIIRTTALYMIIFVVSIHAGTVIVEASETETNAVLEQDSVVSKNELTYIRYSEYSDQYVYSFKDFRSYGVATPEADEHSMIYLEGVYGIRISTLDGRTVYEPYAHHRAVSDTAQMTLYEVKDGERIKIKSFGTVNVDTEYNLSYKLKDDVLYIISAAFTIEGLENEQEALGFLYRTGSKTSTCRVSGNIYDASSIDEQITRWNKLLEDANPDDYLSNDKITYPTSGSGGAVRHVTQWEEISDTLVKRDDWTDEMKVFAFVDYLSKNVAYDTYRTNQENNRSRASIAGDYTKDKYFTLGNNVGVCWDFANILAIMCRHHGIPCTSVENDYHTINAVWLGGEWLGIDITDTVRYNCVTADTDKVNWQKHGPTYKFYGSYGGWSTFDTVNESIWTYEKGLGLK